jgi:hypothetical protein
MHATRPAHLRDSIILIIFGEVYNLRNSSLHNFLKHPVTSSLFGPNILLSTLKCMALLSYQTPSSTPIQKYWQNYRFVYFNYYVFRQLGSRTSRSVHRWARGRTVGVQFPAGSIDSSLFHSVQTALGPTQPPNQRVKEDIFRGVKPPGRESDHSPPSNAEVKNCVSIPPLPDTPSCRGIQLIRHRDNFTFFL